MHSTPPLAPPHPAPSLPPRFEPGRGSTPWKEKREAALKLLWPRLATDKRYRAAAERLVAQAAEGHAWQADHIHAVYEGGSISSLDNLCTLCTVCHMGNGGGSGSRGRGLGLGVEGAVKGRLPAAALHGMVKGTSWWGRERGRPAASVHRWLAIALV